MREHSDKCQREFQTMESSVVCLTQSFTCEWTGDRQSLHWTIVTLETPSWWILNAPCGLKSHLTINAILQFCEASRIIFNNAFSPLFVYLVKLLKWTLLWVSIDAECKCSDGITIVDEIVNNSCRRSWNLRSKLLLLI